MYFDSTKEGQNQPIRAAVQVLNSADRKKLTIVTLAQTTLGILDLVGVAMFGILGALSISGIQSKTPGGKIGTVLEILHIDQLEFQTQVAILAILSAFLLVGRTIVSAIITKRTLRFLSFRGADISVRLANAIMREPLLATQQRVIQNVIFGITGAVNSLVIGVIGSLILLVADISLLLLLFSGLLFVDISLAVGTLVFFGLIGWFLHRIMHTSANNLGAENSRLQIRINSSLFESLVSKKEIYVRDRVGHYIKKFSEEKHQLAIIEARQAFLPNVSKYVLESSVLLGALLISGYQFISQDAVTAIGNLSIFLAAGMRIAPAVLRVQQGFLNIKLHTGASRPALDLMSELDISGSNNQSSVTLEFTHSDFFGLCRLQEINFKYSEKSEWALKDINLDIEPGSFVAIVGSSGAGKTTLVDLLLGLIDPSSGRILISGLEPHLAIHKWPGAVGYVPQETAILNTTISENVALGYSRDEIKMELVTNALTSAKLNDFVLTLEDGINTEVGERGLNLSGGQRQRLGIARALYTQPKLIVLDEATSSLDAETEKLIGESLQNLRGEITLIAIAHRLSTVMMADKVVYLENGRILAQGTFAQVRSAIPNFDNQAKLLGL